ncbi:MAG: phosphoribosylformylglycinamidine cyclo-ligase [Gammaproteobacteria bacterium]|nr:phosphoribosylformylglycinamidine cyclo-ligase [Gammaproteobacteria bacterium]
MTKGGYPVSSDKSPPKDSLSYLDAGVNIDAGNRLVENIKPLAAKTHRPGVMAGLGGFGALFELPLQKYRQPILVSGTDGVGTKLLLAKQVGIHDTVGIDLVAMCVNDIIVQGAEPLFFLDYMATGKLEVDVATDIIKGISEGCVLAGAALVGGETAEMPGMYQEKDYDLAGFCVGIVDKEKLIDGSTIRNGDTLIGLASSGPHSNGYSLIRKIIDISKTSLSDTFGETSLGKTLLTPTKIYVKSILALLDKININGLCHITGGGLTENLPRILPADCSTTIQRNAWPRPEIFNWLQQQGSVTDKEMYRTFNCGIGMVIIVNKADVNKSMDILEQQGEKAYVIGNVTQTHNEQVIFA